MSALRAAGVTDAAIMDATYVCAGFNVISRIANALDFEVPPTRTFERAARFLLRFGYRRLSGASLGTPEASAHGDEVDPFGVDAAVAGRYHGLFKKLTDAVLSDAGALPPAVRRRASRQEAIVGALGGYVQKVAGRACTVTDDDVDALIEAGYTQDQIFEATVSAALGAGLIRMKSGHAALMASVPRDEGPGLERDYAAWR